MKTILFDEMTRVEVTTRKKAMDDVNTQIAALQKAFDSHALALNTIVVTVARMSDCLSTDLVGLNEDGTGVVITPAPVEDEAAPAEAIPMPPDGMVGAVVPKGRR